MPAVLELARSLQEECSGDREVWYLSAMAYTMNGRFGRDP